MGGVFAWGLFSDLAVSGGSPWAGAPFFLLSDVPKK